MELTYGSVCSGIEAATIAWHPLGWKPLWFSQFDPEHNYKNGPDFPSRVLAHHYPSVINLGNMLDIEPMIRAGMVEAPDVLVGGTPCQSWSVAGKREDRDDARGQLTFEFLHLVRTVNPKFVAWENVPGIISSEDGGALAQFLDELISMGYLINCDILDAQFFGLAQRRRRIFVVCQRADILMKQRTHTSSLTMAALLAELLLDILDARMMGSKKEHARLKLKRASVENGLRRKIGCFSAHGDELLQTWLTNCAETFLSVHTEQELSELNLGLSIKQILIDFQSEVTEFSDSCDTREALTASQSMSTLSLLRKNLDEILQVTSEYITSTGSNQITDQKIYSCAETLNIIGKYIARSKHSCPQWFKAARSFMTLNRRLTSYARHTNSELFSELRIHGWRDDFVREAEQHGTTIGGIGEGSDTSTIFFKQNGVFRDSPPSRETGEKVTGNVAPNTYECGGIGSYLSGEETSPLLKSGADLGNGCEALISVHDRQSSGEYGDADIVEAMSTSLKRCRHGITNPRVT